MSAQEEHRGWEIEDDYNPHPLDDADWDIDPSDEPTRYHLPILGAVFAVIVLFGLHFEAQYVTPPIVRLPEPGQPIFTQQITWPKGLRVLDCIHYDTGEGVMRPNYENPDCTAERSKKRISGLLTNH